MLAKEPIAAVVSSQFVRTRLTVSPVAERFGLEVEEIDAHDYDGVVARIRRLEAGRAAVVCGHSNTVPEILARLGVASPPSEAEVVYGDLYVVRLVNGRAAGFERRRYGDP
jgi:broad specificity phosphatase PhoE